MNLLPGATMSLVGHKYMDLVPQAKSVVRISKEVKPRRNLALHGRLWLKKDCSAIDDDHDDEEDEKDVGERKL